MINFVFAENIQFENTHILEKAALAALKYENAPDDSEVTIAIENDDTLHRLNLAFLGIDKPTDVLSFPSGEEEINIETGRPYLGDIIISLAKASNQANSAGHSVTAELQLLVVHGVLHLLGYDHADDNQKIEMWAHQRSILAEIGCILAKDPGE